MRPEAQTFTSKDGREFTFLFDHRGIVAAEKAGDSGFGELLADMARGHIGALASLVYGGLKAFHPQITQDEAWVLMEEEGEPLALALGEAIKASRPGQMVLKQVESAEGNAETPAKKPAPTSKPGTRSSGRGSKKG